MTENIVEEIAFGFSRNLPGFKKIAPQAQNYSDMGLDPFLPDFSNQLLTALRSAKRIHFDLSKMRFLNTADGFLRGPTHYHPIGPTNWELRTIWDAPALRAKTTFYRDGKILSPDDILNLH